MLSKEPWRSSFEAIGEDHKRPVYFASGKCYSSGFCSQPGPEPLFREALICSVDHDHEIMVKIVNNQHSDILFRLDSRLSSGEQGPRNAQRCIASRKVDFVWELAQRCGMQASLLACGKRLGRGKDVLRLSSLSVPRPRTMGST